MISLDNIDFYHGPPRVSVRPQTYKPILQDIPTTPISSLPTHRPADGPLGRNREDQTPGMELALDLRATAKSRDLSAISVNDNMTSILGVPGPEHLDFPSLEVLQATAHEGVMEGYPLTVYDTQSGHWATDVSLDYSFDEISFDMSTGERSRSGLKDGVPTSNDFIPIERFSSQHDCFIPSVDLSKSAEDQGSWRPSCIRSQSVLGDSGETPILITDSEESDASSDSVNEYSLETKSSIGPTFNALKDSFTSRDVHSGADGSIRQSEVDIASRSRGSSADQKRETNKDSQSPPPSATTASPLEDSPAVIIEGTHIAITTPMTTEHQSTQVSQSDEAAEAKPSLGCFDDLSEDELHGPSLYPVVRLKRSIAAKKAGTAVRRRLPSPCFLWESGSETDNSVMGATIAKKVVKATAAKKRSRAPIRG